MRELCLEDAVSVLREEGTLIYPTETFYGIGCRISSDKAISSVFQVKKRLLALPLPTIASDLEQVFSCTQLSSSLIKDVEDMAVLFWPGPLTFVLPARKSVSPLLTGGTGDIALRLSSHPVAAALAKGAGEPIVSSSANISGKLPASDFQELDKDLLSHVSGYVDLPPKPLGGLASTLVELKGGRTVKVLREGAISSNQIRECGFSVLQRVL